MSDPQNFQQPTPQEIADHAYYLWDSEGRVHGRDIEYWLQAEAHLVKNRQHKAGLLQESDAKIPQGEKPAESSTSSANVGRTSRRRSVAGGVQKNYAGSSY